jgi:hypothetical protein
MQTEANIPAEYRYLRGDSVIMDSELSLLRSGVVDFMKNRAKDNAYQRYMHWKKLTNEFAVLTTYSYADVPLPKTYDTIFLCRKPSIKVHINYTVTQAIINGWTPVEQLHCGHKHVVIIQFHDLIPPICDGLPAFRVGQSWNVTSDLGFCNFQDYSAICERLTRT